MPAPAQAVEVTNYYAPSDGHVVLCSVATRNTDGSRTWYANVKDEVEGRERAKQVKVMLDIGEDAPITAHERPAVTTDAQYMSDKSDNYGRCAEDDARLAAEVRPCAEEYAADLDRLLAWGELIDRSSLKTPAELHTLNYAEQEGHVVKANECEPNPLYKLTESGRWFLSKFSPVGR